MMLSEQMQGILGGVLLVLIHGGLYALAYFWDQWYTRRMLRKAGPIPPKARKAPRKADPPRSPNSFDFTYSCANRYEGNLSEMSRELEKYTLSNVEFVTHEGYLATVRQTDVSTGTQSVRYWYGLDKCVLRCTEATADEKFHYRIDTMVVDKSIRDCGAHWRNANPDRVMRVLVELSYEEVNAIIVLHHKKPQTANMPKSVTAVTAPPVALEPKPMDDTPEIHVPVLRNMGKCGELLIWRLEGDTLRISGTGRLNRCRDDWRGRDQEIRHVVIEPGCTAIGDYVFLNCRSLETIFLPDTLRTIGERAFAYCTNLQSVTIPDSVTGIGKGAFAHCKNLTRVFLPRNLAQIHPYTFCCCERLQNVRIPDGVHYIGTRAFYRVKSVNNLPRNLGNWGTKTPGYSKRPYGLDEEAFAYAGLPNHVEIPDRIQTIPKDAFWGCETLVSVTFPRCLREIGPGAFACCTNLTDLVIPVSVTKIGKDAFHNVPHVIYRGCAESPNNGNARA
ncbi:MAG: leucine-rich repeat domain-containing protein [Oscillospiraceae bacterium]|nr:leucine-rich repeat domain-containing protein [Oscillospiraceae bacterium]